jgi:hypothetical protein
MNDNTAAFLATTLITVAVTICTLVWIRTRARPKAGSAELTAILQRLERMEQSIDAMAVETERISEGQRFTTKLLSERAKEPAPRP